MPFTWRININKCTGASSYEYSPALLSPVAIADEIIWTNNDDVPHRPGLADGSGKLVDKAYFMANQIAPHSPSAAFVPGVNGTVSFVDALDTTGFAGTAGSQNVFPSAAEAASPVPIDGTLSKFQAHVGSAVGGSGVTLTVLKNGSATTITCAIAIGNSSCTDSTHTVSLTTTDVIAVRIQNATGTFVRQVAWTAQLG